MKRLTHSLAMTGRTLRDLDPVAALCLLLLLGCTARMGHIAGTATSQLVEADGWVSHTYQVLGELAGARSLVEHATPERREAQLRAYLSRIKNLTADNPAQQERIEQMLNAATQAGERREFLLQMMEDEERRLLAERQTRSRLYLDSVRQWSITLSGLAVGLTLGMAALYVRDRRHGIELRDALSRYRLMIKTQSKAIVTAKWEWSKKDAVIVCDDLGWNAAASALWGYSFEEVAGRSLQMLMPSQFRPLHSEGLARYMSGGGSRIIGTTITPEIVPGFAILHKSGRQIPATLDLSAWTLNGETYFSGVLDTFEPEDAERMRALRWLEANADVQYLKELVAARERQGEGAPGRGSAKQQSDECHAVIQDNEPQTSL